MILWKWPDNGGGLRISGENPSPDIHGSNLFIYWFLNVCPNRHAY